MGCNAAETQDLEIYFLFRLPHASAKLLMIPLLLWGVRTRKKEPINKVVLDPQWTQVLLGFGA